MKTQFDIISEVIKGVGLENASISEIQQYLRKHKKKFEKAFANANSAARGGDTGDQAKCVRDHAGQCGVCSEGVFFPCA